MKEVKNKRISVEDIKSILLLINKRAEQLNDLFLKYEEEDNKGYNHEVNNSYKDIIVNFRPSLEISVTISGSTETRNDVNWFIDCLDKNTKLIENVIIHYSAFYFRKATNNETFKGLRAEESIYIFIKTDEFNITYNYKNQREEFDALKNKIDELLDDLPINCDNTIAHRQSREFLPGLSTSLSIGLFLGLVVYLIFYFKPVDIFIKDFIFSIYYIPTIFLIFLLMGCVFPGKNNSLYRQLNIKTKYAGYSLEKGESIYEDDVNKYVQSPEIEIGESFNNGKLRQKIELNYKKAKRFVAIKILLFIILFVITVIL